MQLGGHTPCAPTHFFINGIHAVQPRMNTTPHESRQGAVPLVTPLTSAANTLTTREQNSSGRTSKLRRPPPSTPSDSCPFVVSPPSFRIRPTPNEHDSTRIETGILHTWHGGNKCRQKLYNNSPPNGLRFRWIRSIFLRFEVVITVQKCCGCNLCRLAL